MIELVGDEDEVVILTAFMQEDIYNCIVANGCKYNDSTIDSIVDMLDEKYFSPVIRSISLQEIKERKKVD